MKAPLTLSPSHGRLHALLAKSRAGLEPRSVGAPAAPSRAFDSTNNRTHIYLRHRHRGDMRRAI